MYKWQIESILVREFGISNPCQVTKFRFYVPFVITKLLHFFAPPPSPLACCQDDGGAAAASATGAVPRTTPPGPGAGLSSNLQCPICLEMFNQATTLGCGHTFCSACLQEARLKIGGSGGDRCPLCRAPVTSAIRSVTLDNIVRSIANDGSYCEVYL